MKNLFTKVILFAFLLTGFISTLSFAQTGTGKVTGTVVDKTTKSPLPGANIIIKDTNTGAASDVNGYFSITNIKAGNYTLEISFIGYKKLIESNVEIKPGRTANFNFELQPNIFESEEVVVSSGYFNKVEKEPVSAISFSNEQIRSAPGSAGDVSRILMILPGVAKVNDQSNSLIVRGGSPMENSFYIDNIEIHNINHFPTQGSSGGPISLVNVEFVEDVQFYSGGFSTAYGNRLSSIMALRFREGDKEKVKTQLDLNFSGFGAVVEGPLLSDKTNWMLSVRRSYLDLLTKALDTGTSTAPRYGDYQFKIASHLSNSDKITVLGILGDDHTDSNGEDASENDMIYYGKQNILKGSAGINWQHLWGKTGYSNTSVSYMYSRLEEDFYETGTAKQLLKNRSDENSVQLRNVNVINLSEKVSTSFGLELRQNIFNVNNIYGSTVTPLGNITPKTYLDNKITNQRAGMFWEFDISPVSALTIKPGVRYDYYDYNSYGSVQPRIGLIYNLNPVTKLSASAGLFTQELPALLQAQNPAVKKLDNPQAIHLIAGISRLLNESTKLSIEGYYKDYTNMPLSGSQPGLFILDEIFYSNGFYSPTANYNNKGKATAYGVEVILQKKLASDFYGLISGAWYRAKYKDETGEEYNRVFDNQYNFAIEGGYKPGGSWEFSARWIYAGGAPYTPFDAEKSELVNKGVYDNGKINSQRYPDYHSLNLRVDKRFYFSSSSLVAYLSVWNAYGRENVAQYYWNTEKNEQDVIYQWSVLPIFGLEYEF